MCLTSAVKVLKCHPYNVLADYVGHSALQLPIFVEDPNAYPRRVALIPDPVHSWQRWTSKRYNEVATCRQMGRRLLNLSLSTYYDAGQRITEQYKWRFLYERTPFYEQGYVFSEIIERYRKMVMQYKKLSLFENEAVYDSFDRVEHIQKLYFEIFHLVMMMHEIPRKYQQFPEFSNVVETNRILKQEQDARAAFKKAQKQRREAIKNYLSSKNRNKGNSTLYETGEYHKDIYNRTLNPKLLKELLHKNFPLDYGWDPAYF